MISGTVVWKTGLVKLIWSFLNVETIALRRGVLPLMGELVNIRTGVNLRPKSANRAFRGTKQGISSSGREMMLFP